MKLLTKSSMIWIVVLCNAQSLVKVNFGSDMHTVNIMEG